MVGTCIARSGVCQRPERRHARNFQHEGMTWLREPQPQWPVPIIDGIGGDPARGDPGRAHASCIEHAKRGFVVSSTASGTPAASRRAIAEGQVRHSPVNVELSSEEVAKTCARLPCPFADLPPPPYVSRLGASRRQICGHESAAPELLHDCSRR